MEVVDKSMDKRVAITTLCKKIKFALTYKNNSERLTLFEENKSTPNKY